MKPYGDSYVPRGNYGGEKKGHGGESKGYGGSKSYGDDDEDVKEVKDSEWSYVGKSSYGTRLYGGKSNGDNEEYIKLVRIVKNIVIKCKGNRLLNLKVVKWEVLVNKNTVENGSVIVFYCFTKILSHEIYEITLFWH